MPKKYTIKVPLYSRPIETLAKLNHSEDIEIIIFGGAPDSPFNGGRMNSSLDGVPLKDRKTLSINQEQMEEATAKFYETLDELNRNGMPFDVVWSNMFVEKEELTEANLYPIQRMVESGQKHGIKNGVIINNALLEEHIRRQFADALMYISSCTRYVSPDRILSPKETTAWYLKDCSKYDYVVLTPQDSRREKLIKNVVKDNKTKIVVISNSYCANACNTYHHYEYMSQQNKISLLKAPLNMKVLSSTIRFMPHTLKCSAYWHMFMPVEVEKMATMQLNAGVVNFKLGRGFGVEKLEKIVELIQKFEDNQKKTKQNSSSPNVLIGDLKKL